MTGNFTITTLIAVLQSELNWHAKNWVDTQKKVKELTDLAVTGKLDEYQFESFFSGITYKHNMTRGNHEARRARHCLFMQFSLPVNRDHFSELDVQALNNDFHAGFANRKDISERVISELLRCSGNEMLWRHYSNYITPKEAPWDGGMQRFDTLQQIVETASRVHPSGLQILINEPRLTDEYSTELYREFDEIIGVLEKINANPKYADDGSKGYQLHYRYWHGTHGGAYDEMVTELRKQLDGPDLRSDADDLDDGYNYRDTTPEKRLVSELTSKWTIPSVLKAVISASVTRNPGLIGRNYIRGPGIAVMRSGYFLDLDKNIINRLFNEGLDEKTLKTVLEDAQYYMTVVPYARVSKDEHQGLAGGLPLNSVRQAYLFEPVDSLHEAAVSWMPISAYMDQIVDFDQAAKNDGNLKVPSIDGFRGYYKLLQDIVFVDRYGHLPFEGARHDTGLAVKPAGWRRTLTRIKGVPLRKVWELPLIVNPFRTVEEIFADLGYELHEVSEPNAKPEAPVRKPGSKRK